MPLREVAVNFVTENGVGTGTIFWNTETEEDFWLVKDDIEVYRK